ncbi:uncharacterized protein CLUP02_15590 [Colletotrichum lupini]|uniref:Uncharacterized protein n=1 Tax=Colletotrichum lupini TaxID=145971 RepID=A0A9Q8T677_9PEZI|nr:uncharacterized protein CLUP02_15590 [Colletotrichum lupini]UQC90059.1 hypothetical protein CLUP02_15590 [Colletotrichum lupini]
MTHISLNHTGQIPMSSPQSFPNGAEEIRNIDDPNYTVYPRHREGLRHLACLSAPPSQFRRTNQLANFFTFTPNWEVAIGPLQQHHRPPICQGKNVNHTRTMFLNCLAGWPNGKASDYDIPWNQEIERSRRLVITPMSPLSSFSTQLQHVSEMAMEFLLS